MTPPSDQLDLVALNAQFKDLTAGQRMAMLWEQFGIQAVASTSFGLQAVVMLKLISDHCPDMPVIFVDTGYNFPETYRYIDTISDTLQVNLQHYSALHSAAQQEARWGKLWEQGSEGLERYAQLNKVEPMNRALTEHKAQVWLSGLRRSQSRTRANREFLELQGDKLKAYPILDWADAQVEHFIRQHDLPTHPLADKGYVTMGDWHSTRPIEEGMTAEETRFNGAKYECGLHYQI